MIVGERVPSGKLTEQWKISIFTRDYILKRVIFHCYVSSPECNPNINWLVVSSQLKNISKNGNLPQVGMKIKNVWNHPQYKTTNQPGFFLSLLYSWGIQLLTSPQTTSRRLFRDLAVDDQLSKLRGFFGCWRIIPLSKWLITMVIVSPLSRDIPLPNGLNGLQMGVILTSY